MTIRVPRPVALALFVAALGWWAACRLTVRAEGLAFPVLKSGALGSMSRTVRFYRWHAEWSTVVKVLRGRGVVIIDGGAA